MLQRFCVRIPLTTTRSPALLHRVSSSAVHSGSNACTELGEHMLPKQEGPVGDIPERDKEERNVVKTHTFLPT